MDWSVPRGLRPHPSCKKKLPPEVRCCQQTQQEASHLPSPSCNSLFKTKHNTFGKRAVPNPKAWPKGGTRGPRQMGKGWVPPRAPPSQHMALLTSLGDGRGDSVPTLHTTACLSSEEEFEEGVKPFPKVCRNTEVLKIFLPLLNLLGQPGHLPPSLTVPSTPCLPNWVLASPPPSLVSAWPLPGMPFAFPSLSKPPLCPGLC